MKKLFYYAKPCLLHFVNIDNNFYREKLFMFSFASLRFSLILIFIASNIFTLPVKTNAFIPSQELAAPSRQISAQTDFKAQLALMEKMLEAKREELGVTGMSVAIVKDDKVVFIKGFGVRDAEKNLPVTPETLFPIGSSTKAFTGMLMAMSVDDGKLAFADSPKKYLSYFKLEDAEADKKITVKDLMMHDSGLTRTELVWYPGILNRREVIQAVAKAKPTAPFGEKFQYQNVMVSAAGEAVASAENSTWEALINKKILQPLGMKQTVLTLPELMRSRDHALGYEYDESVKTARRIPFRSQRAVSSIAPAGSIYSNAGDMAQWIRFMLAGGVFDGKRLVSEKNFNEIVSPQMKNIGGTDTSYGLGWFLINRKGHKIVQHGGSIDGFRAEVSMMPDEHLDFVILTNSYKTPLVAPDSGGSGLAEEIIWSNLLDEQKTDDTADAKNSKSAENPQQEVGKYQVANLTVEVTMNGENLVLNVPNQPAYPLENVGGRRYKFAGNATSTAGHFVTFRPSEGNSEKTEMFLEQPPPKRDVVLTKISSEFETPKTTGEKEQYKDLIGTYEAQEKDQKMVFQLTMQNGKLTILRPGQRSLTLVEKGKDNFSIAGAPDTYEISVKRNEAGKPTSLVAKQPNGNFEMQRVEDYKSSISTEGLMTRMISALGGETNLRKHKTLEMTYDIDLVNQGVNGTGTISIKAPNSKSNVMTISALGKRLGTIREYFDGTTGGTISSFLPSETKSEKELVLERAESDFYAPLDWRESYKTIEIKGTTKIGDEEAYIVVKTLNDGSPITDYISTKSYLLLKRDSPRGTAEYGDYREVDGVMLPFKRTIENPNTGGQIINITTAKFDVPMADDIFTGTSKMR